MTTLSPSSVEDVVAAVRDHARVVPHGALTKQPLVAAADDAVHLDLTGLSGITACDAAEFTFTARAGTPLREIAAVLAAQNQYMPFDPPLADSGATIGGTVAAGLNGAGRLRYGGLRDFIIGVRFVDGTARAVSGGGRVVKNAAGFDLPKLMIGSMGRLGVLLEFTFKVFPAPRVRRTVRVMCTDLADALSCSVTLVRQPLDLESLELEPPATLMIRVGGDNTAVDSHARRVGAATGRAFEVCADHSEDDWWRLNREFGWLEPGQVLIRMPLTLRDVLRLDAVIEPLGIRRRYGVAGNVAWLGWPVDRPLAALDSIQLRGTVVRGPWPAGLTPAVGPPQTGAAPFARAVKHALDPHHRFAGLI